MDLAPKKKAVQLERGSWIHDLLMVHYDGEDWRERHRELAKRFNNLFEEEREMLGDLPRECLRIMKSYLYTYEQEDKKFRVVDSELNEIVTLPNGLEVNVVVDLIMEDQRGGLWPWDHKTRGSFEELDIIIMDPQKSIYFDALEIMGYTPLRGVGENEIRTKPPAVPALLARGGLSKRKNIDTDVRTYMAAIRRQGLDPRDYSEILRLIASRQKDRFFRRTAIPKDRPVLRTARRELVQSAREIRFAERKAVYPRTVDRSCKWGCEFRDICFADLHGADISSMIKMNFTNRKDRDEK
jgi:hypothetical protein